MASSASRSGKLKDTLGELESALSSWDQIIPNAPDDSVDDTSAISANGAKPRGSNASEEMKRRTRELLNQLKEQIDELSSDCE